MNWSQRVEQYIEKWGGVGGGKGTGNAQKQLDLQNKLTQQAFDLMQQRQNQVNSSVSKYMSGSGEGFDPAQLALMRSQFLNQNAQAYNQGAKNIRTALLRSGSSDGSNPMGGDAIRGLSGLQGAMASNLSGGLANIDLSNLQQALYNKFNAASLVNGQAAQLTSPISSFNSGASNALNAYIQAANQGFGNAFTTAFGGALGKGLGTGITGGIGNTMSRIPGFG